MIAAIKSEFRKLYTIRSTYVIVGLSLALVALLTFWVEGIKNASAVSQDPNRLASEIVNAVQIVSLILPFVGLLLVTHEYRYNTIMHTLTSSNSRTKTLFAKILAIGLFSIIFGMILAVLGPVFTYIATHFFKGMDFVHQEFVWSSILWRCVFCAWGYGMIGLLLAVLVRNQVAAIAAFLVIPMTIEPLLSLLLKSNAIYLPFSSLGAVTAKGSISYAHAAAVFMIYMVVGWAIAWVLFLRRDATN